MIADRFSPFMVFVFIGVLGYFTYQIFQPFLTAIAWAMVFCTIFYPVYVFSLRYLRLKAMAALLTLLLIVAVIIGPFSYIAFALVSELGDLFGHGGTGGVESIQTVLADPRVRGIIERIQPYIGISAGSAEQLIVENARKLGGVIVGQLSAGFTNLLSVAANFVIMLFTSFFLLRDGPDFLEKLRDYLPFSEEQKNRLEVQTRDMVVSTIYGGVVVAIVQGILGGLAFLVLGMDSPVLWGSVMSLVSFIPMFGTAIVWVPASIILAAQGAYFKCIALVLIGVFVIGMADNILKPLIIGGRTKMPTVIIFFTVLGGIKVFGLLGLILGPLVFALFLSVFEIFRTMEGGPYA